MHARNPVNVSTIHLLLCVVLIMLYIILHAMRVVPVKPVW